MDNLERAEIAASAAVLWASFTDNERGMIRFGMFPAGKMQAAERELSHIRDHTRLLAVALMNEAKRDGGMRA